MQIWILIGIALTVVIMVSVTRTRKDQADIAAKVRSLGGVLVEAKRARAGHPFPSTGRGWWAWRVRWQDGMGERVSWALTTREGISDWRD